MRIKKEKDKFDALNDTFKDSVNAAQSEELRARLAKIALAQVSLNEAKNTDEKLSEAVDIVKELSAPYRDELKELKLQTEYLYRVLSDRGEDVQAFGST